MLLAAGMLLWPDIISMRGYVAALIALGAGAAVTILVSPRLLHGPGEALSRRIGGDRFDYLEKIEDLRKSLADTQELRPALERICEGLRHALKLVEVRVLFRDGAEVVRHVASPQPHSWAIRTATAGQFCLPRKLDLNCRRDSSATKSTTTIFAKIGDGLQMLRISVPAHDGFQGTGVGMSVGVGGLVVGDPLAVSVTAQDANVLGFDCRDDLRAVGGDDELGVREGAHQVAEHTLLPRGVEMQVHLVDENDGGGGKRVDDFVHALAMIVLGGGVEVS